MKRTLLSAALVMAAFAANAQIEVGYLDGPSLGILGSSSSEGTTALPAGTVFCTTEHLTVTSPYDDTYVAPGMKTGTVLFDGTELQIPAQVVQGQNNGAAASVAATDFEASIGKSMFEITSTEDGYVYAVISASGNKNYVVYENQGDRQPYVFSMENTNDETAPAVYSYDISTMDGALYYVDFGDGTGDYYVDPNFSIQQVSQICDGETVSTTGNGVIKFRVYVGIPYEVFATGSKITLGAVVFDTTGDATVTTSNGNTLLEAGQVPGTSTGITSVVVEDETTDADAPAYNIAGQRVSKNAKGLVIINGKKVLRK